MVNQDTIFSTLILNSADVPSQVECFPAPIMRWSETFFRPVFGALGEFALRENDYVFGHRKFGGNAQAITRGRFVHHTSFLWDLDPRLMALLRNPAKQPTYRAKRGHGDFLCSLRPLAESAGLARRALIDKLAG